MSGIAVHQMMVRDALAAGMCRTTEELALMTGLPRKAVAKAAGKLILRGLAERVEIGCYRLTETGRASASTKEVLTSGPNRRLTAKVRPAPKSFRQRAWAAMRMCGKFTIPQIVQLASEGQRHPHDNLHTWFRALERAGYLRRLPVRERGTAPGSNGFIRWMLMLDTGPGAPMVRNDGTVVDRNTGEVFEREENAA